MENVRTRFGVGQQAEKIQQREICKGKVRSQKEKTTLFGKFSQHGGGVFPNPKTFVNLPSIFLYAKLGPKWPQMVKNMLY